MTKPTSITPTYDTLSGIPAVDIPANVHAALAKGRRATGIAAEAAALRFGPSRLSPQEYFVYRLWDGALPLTAKRAFVGKLAQHPMHVAAGNGEWFACSDDKILFHMIMAGVRFRVPETIAITQSGRHLPDVPTLDEAGNLARFLREPSLYPLFAKPVAGKYSLSVVSAEGYDPCSDEVILLVDAREAVSAFAAALVGGQGYLIQRRLSPSCVLADCFGPRLWSLRLLVFITPDGPLIHRAAVKIATGINPADNYWRNGNRLGALDLETGRIKRVVKGTGLELAEDAVHPDTGHNIVGTTIPHWEQIVTEVKLAAKTFAGIRTQSWDIALSDPAPTFLDMNFGRDLNLNQLAHGAGVLDYVYRAHLRRCGYRGRL